MENQYVYAISFVTVSGPLFPSLLQLHQHNFCAATQELTQLLLSPSCPWKDKFVEQKTGILITSARKLLPRNALCSVLLIHFKLELFPGKCYSKTWLFLQNLTNGCLSAVKLTEMAQSNTSLGLSATRSWLSSVPFRVTAACTSYYTTCFTFVEPFFPPSLDEA